jgi:hypothetical protein
MEHHLTLPYLTLPYLTLPYLAFHYLTLLAYFAYFEKMLNLQQI